MLEELLKLFGGGQGGFVPPDRQMGAALSPAELGVPSGGGLMALLGGQQPQQAAPQPQQANTSQELSAQSRAPQPASPASSINFGDIFNRIGPALMMASGDPHYISAGAALAGQQSKNSQSAHDKQIAQQRVTQTYQWLVGQGKNPQEAAIIASDPAMIREYMKPKDPEYKEIGKDEYQRPKYGWVYPSSKRIDPIGGQSQQQSGTSDQSAAPASAIAEVRKEVQNLPSYKNLAQAAPIYSSMYETAGRNTRASDLNLVYGLGKLFDPASVVREGEMILVKDAGNLPAGLADIISRLNQGGALTPATRFNLMKEAHSRMTSYKQIFDQDTQFYGGIADRHRINRADIIPSFPEFQEYKQTVDQPASAVQPSGDGWTVMPNGVRIREKK